MSNGIIVFGHNSKEIDYVKMASFSAKLANKNLSVPVSLITDEDSLNNTEADLKIFDQVIVKEKSKLLNTRMLQEKIIEFNNLNRSDAYNLTPYDRTLLIDSDLLLYSNFLNNYWDYNSEFLICEGMNIIGEDNKFLDSVISYNSIPTAYATAIFFSKTEKVKQLFELVEYIKEHWKYFFDIYNMASNSFRNDFAFSIANHILTGFKNPDNLLPKILMTSNKTEVKFLDTDKIILNVDGSTVEITNTDVHIWNKISLLECLKNE